MQMRQHTAASWVSNNPTPSLGQWCLETDTKLKKVGDGVTAWNSLAYCRGDTAVQPDAIGTAAALDAGTADGNVVVVATGGKLPALDGSDLTNLPGGSGGGKIAQIVSSSTSTLTSVTTVIPWDNTIPQKTEGAEIITRAITPTNASSTLLIEVTGFCGVSAATNGAAALFVDSTADAVAAIGFAPVYATPVVIRFSVAAGSTSARTYKFRVGPGSAVTLYWNGQNTSGAIYGGTPSTVMTVTEILP